MPNSYVTTPIYYVNDVPHIGHAYTTIATDIYARYRALSGDDVKFLTGCDEHGQKVDASATKAGTDPQSFTDELSKSFRELVASGDNLLNVTNSDFIRTTEERHKLAAQALWNKLQENGYIYKDTYAGWYSVRDEAFYQEKELVEGKAPTGAEVEWVEEESYFFKLSALSDKLLALYKTDFIYPKGRANEVISFVEGGLKDLSISRTTFNWGVPVPNDDKHVMYVWIDALTNYLTSCGYPDGAEMEQFWDNGNPIHFVGKDILRFHAVYWPAMLMAADISLPSKIVAHGWWTIDGEKMSKSIGNVIAPKTLLDNYGSDYTRYFMLREVPFGNDGNFSDDALKTRINAELANNIGNLAQRSLSMIFKNVQGQIYTLDSYAAKPKFDDIYDNDLPQAVENYRHAMDNFAFSKAIEAILQLSSKLNEVFDELAPWKLKNDNPQEMAAILYAVADLVRCIFILLQPLTPIACDKLLSQMKIDVANRGLDSVLLKGNFNKNVVIEKPEGVFPRIVL